jgi:uncharacterized membrane protein
MLQLVVLAYADEHRAAEVSATLQRLRIDSLLEPDGILVVVRRTDWNVTLQHGVSLAAWNEDSTHFWRALISSLILAPGSSGQRPCPSKYGLEPGFERELGAALPPGGSAVFMLLPKRNLLRVSILLDGFGGTLIKSRLVRGRDPQRAALSAVAQN